MRTLGTAVDWTPANDYDCKCRSDLKCQSFGLATGSSGEINPPIRGLLYGAGVEVGVGLIHRLILVSVASLRTNRIVCHVYPNYPPPHVKETLP